MRIGLDISNAVLPSPTGVAVYVRLLVEHLRRQPQGELKLYCRRSRRRYLKHCPWAQSQPPGSVTEFTTHVRERDVDLFHATDVRLPLWCEPPSVVTIHDLSALERSDHATPRFLRKKRRAYQRAAHNATTIITQTECVKRQIVDALHAEHVRVIPLADALSVNHPPRAFEQRRGNDALVVGGPSRRKGVHLLQPLLTALSSHGWNPQLQWVGSTPAESAHDLLAEHALSSRVQFHGHVSEEQLTQLYQQCRALLVFSETEGFGMPLLEAAARRCPVIAPDSEVFREVLGNGGFWYRGSAPTGLETFFDEDSHTTHVDHAEASAARYSWDRTARETWDCYATSLHRSIAAKK